MKFFAIATIFAAAASALPGPAPAPQPGSMALEARMPRQDMTAAQLSAQGCDVGVCLETLAGLGITCVISKIAGCVATALLVDPTIEDKCLGCI